MIPDLKSFLINKRLRRAGCRVKSGFRFKANTFYQFEPNTHLSALKINGDNLKIGAHTYIRSGSELSGDIEIGRFCSISNNVFIGLERSAHLMHSVSTSFFDSTFYQKIPRSNTKTLIGHDCWIGKNAILMAGIKLGTGCVIGAGAVVTRDVPPYAIVGGIPAKIIKYRFDPTLQKALLDSLWWQADPEMLMKLPMEDPEQFLKRYIRPVSEHNYPLMVVKNKRLSID